MLFVAFAIVLLIVAMTRPGPGRMFRGRYRRHQATQYQPLRPSRETADIAAGLRDPSRPL